LSLFLLRRDQKVLIVTPGQLNRRAEIYLQLGTLIASGVPIPGAVGMVAQGRWGKMRTSLVQLQASLSHGNTLYDSLRAQVPRLPDFDLALLNAAEQSGRLDACFRLLAEYYQERAALARETISSLMYPLFLAHFAVFILPFPQLFTSGDVPHYLWQTLGVLVPFYGVVALAIFACQGTRGERWRRFLERLFSGLPLVGESRRSLALSRLSMALEALINAGVSIVSAWPMAAEASGSIRLKYLVARWREPLASGQTPSELVAESSYFGEPFTGLYRTGETSGQLDETLRKLQTYYREQATHRMRLVAQWAPRAVYLVVVLAITFKIISFYMGYFSGLNSLLNEVN
jgi:type II secretory pathway component PulF